jgi:hypothetical protein
MDFCPDMDFFVSSGQIKTLHWPTHSTGLHWTPLYFKDSSGIPCKLLHGIPWSFWSPLESTGVQWKSNKIPTELHASPMDSTLDSNQNFTKFNQNPLYFNQILVTPIKVHWTPTGLWLEVSGLSWRWLEVIGLLWNSVELCGLPWTSLEFHWSPLEWVGQCKVLGQICKDSFWGFLRIPKEFCRVLEEFEGVLEEFEGVLEEFEGVLRSFTESLRNLKESLRNPAESLRNLKES